MTLLNDFVTALSIPDLSMGGRQSVLIVVFFIIAIIIASIFVAVAFASRNDKTYAQVSKVGYGLRRYWLVLLLVVAATQVIVSAAFTPYSTSAKPDAIVKITGYQFNWTFAPQRVKAGSLTRFDVTTSDVTHGVGLYDPDGQLMASVQAMPGYTNKFEVRLKKPGKYLVACMEYCGIGHHKMLQNFTVYREN